MQSPELALELRAARPVASPALRERVGGLAAAAPAPRRPRLVLASARYVVGLAAAAAVAIGIGFAAVHGITHSGANADAPHGVASGGNGVDRLRGSAARSATKETYAQNPLALPRAVARLQQYGASLHVQVKDREALSDATKRAMRVARLLGGYVASVRYSAARRGVGAATIVVRVPVDRVEDAVGEYAALGTLLRQRLAINDVTKAVDEQAKEIARLRAEIARIEAGGVTSSERPRLAALRARLDYLTKRRKATIRRAQLARVSLALTTKPKRAAAAAGRFERTLDDAGGVLLREAEILVYALIVAGPLLLLAAAGVGAARLVQRRRDAQLLERA